MKNFIKLVHFEFSRFFPIYAALAVLTIVIQFIGVFVTTNDYINQIESSNQMGVTKESDVILEIGMMGINRFVGNLWFWAPIGLCIVALIIYSLFIWYRDWLGKNTFIYRLLMLPTERVNMYFSKAVTIFLMVLGLLALQLILIFVENQLFSVLIPESYYASTTVSRVILESGYLSTFYPTSFILFIAYYSRGFMALLALFTVILLERSFKFKGILLAGVYGLSILIFQFSPYWLQVVFNRQLFFSSEVFWISLVLTYVIGAASTLLSHHLLNKKITV